MTLDIFNSTDEVVCKIADFSYHAVDMGDANISCSIAYTNIQNAIPGAGTVGLYIDNEPDFKGWYTEFNNDKFVLYSQNPNGSKNEKELPYKFDLVFNSVREELKDILFMDIVPVEYSASLHTENSQFNFFGTFKEFLGRFNANCQTNLPQWIATYTGDDTEAMLFDATDLYLWDALVKAFEIYKIRYKFNGRVVEFGDTSQVLPITFEYGYNKGLYSISRTPTNNKIVTRAYPTGSDRNLPLNYFKEHYVDSYNANDVILPDGFPGLYLKNLMPKEFRDSLRNFEVDQKLIPYIDAPAETMAMYGIKHGRIVFEDIYPSIEGVVKNGHRIDQIVAVDTAEFDPDNIDDDGFKSYFHIWIPDIGFNPDDFASPETALFSIKDGNCAGNEFEIQMNKNGTYITKIDESKVGVNGVRSKYRLTCKKSQDNNNFILPNKFVYPKAGDHYVLLKIFMPLEYILNAEERLSEKTKEWLKDSDKYKYTYSSGFAEEFIERIQIPLDLFKEGNLVNIKDTKLINLDGNIVTMNINGITIEYKSDSVLPTYQLELSNEVLLMATKVQLIEVNMQRQRDAYLQMVAVNDVEARRNERSMNEFRSKVFDPDGKFNKDNFGAATIDTISLSAGADSAHFGSGLSQTGVWSFSDNYNIVYWNPNPPNLHHRVYSRGNGENEEDNTWNLTSGSFDLRSLDNPLDNPDQMPISSISPYVYIRASKSSSNATVVITTLKHNTIDDPDYFYFWFGTISSLLMNSRSVTDITEKATLSGGSIVGARIYSTNYNESAGSGLKIDLNNGTVFGKITFMSNTGDIVNVADIAEASQYVEVSYTSNVFKYSTGATTPSPSIITLVANYHNFTPENKQWQYFDGSTWINISGANDNTYNITPDGTWSQRTFRILADSDKTDEVTIVKLSDGESAYNVILSNETISIPTNSDGSGAILTGANTLITVYKGTTKLAYPTAYNVAKTDVNCTSTLSQSGTDAKITINSISQRDNKVNIIITIN